MPNEDKRNTKHLDATALQKDLLHLLKDENIKITFEADKSDKTTDIETNEDDRAPHSTEELYYYHPDHLGTATFLTDNNGNPYQFFLNLPFGETMAEQRSSSGNFNNRWKFNGKELDEETGLYYYGVRFYNPSTSLWLSVDPLVEQTMDAYGYCYQNPIILVDPDGRSPQDHGDPLSLVIGFIGDARASVNNTVARLIGSNKRFIGDGYTGMYQVAKKDSPSQVMDIINIGLARLTVKNRGNGVFYGKAGSMTISSIRNVLADNLKKFSKFDIKTFWSKSDKYGHGKCEKFANDTFDLMGGDLKKINHKGGLSHLTNKGDVGISDTGVHYFVEKVIDGKSYIFDNVYRSGVLKADYERSLGGIGKSGTDLVKEAKTVKSMDDLAPATKNTKQDYY